MAIEKTISPGLGERLAAALCALDDDALARARKALASLIEYPDSKLAVQALTRALAAPAQTARTQASVLSSAAVAHKVQPLQSHLRLVRPAPPHGKRGSEKPSPGSPPKAVALPQGAQHE